MPTPEGKVKDAVRKFLKERGVWYYQPVQNGMGVVGIPDFVCCWHGKFLAIETKAPGKRRDTTANQDRVIAQINQHGGLAVVVDDVSQLAPVFEGAHHAQVHTPQAGLSESLQRPTRRGGQAGEEQRRTP